MDNHTRARVLASRVSPMGAEARPGPCCTVKSGLRWVMGLFSVSTIVYVYLYNASILEMGKPLNLHPRLNMSEWRIDVLNLRAGGLASRILLHSGNKTSSNSSIASNKTREFVPLLTLFTTWPSDDKKPLVRNITLRNWAEFKPIVRPVFFYSPGTNISSAKKYGWETLPVSKDALGIPILKNMYLDAMKKFKSLFYGYSNGDLIFDSGLIDTLLTVANTSVREDKPIMIIGKRTNVNNVTMKETEDYENLPKIAKRGKMFIPIAQDFFITDTMFPWADIPGVVIGRRAYDNWLVLYSCKEKHTVIDVSNTMLALHQSTKAGNFEGHTHKNGEYNAQLLYKTYRNIRYGAGTTACAHYFTQWVGDGNKKMQLSRRVKLDKVCYPY